MIFCARKTGVVKSNLQQLLLHSAKNKQYEKHLSA